MLKKKTILVTGGAGFIGSALIRHIINNTSHKVVNVDKLTYSGNLQSLESIGENNNYIFEQIDICQTDKIKKIFEKYRPDIVIHLAASTHVDRSIDSPKSFIESNIYGVFNLLEAFREFNKKNK